MVDPADAGLFPTEEPPVASLLLSAAVDGTALTLTFDQALQTASTPAPGAFDVRVNGARRHVEAGGVAVSGKMVTLTLASTVSVDDTVTVSYDRLSPSPLRNAHGIAVADFAQGVTNNTPFWEATLTVGRNTGALGCFLNLPCSGQLTEDNFTVGGTRYQFNQILGVVGRPYLAITLDNPISQGWTLHVDDLQLPIANAKLTDNDETASWSDPGFTWTEHQKVSLRLTLPRPEVESAAVDGTALVLTFDQDLDPASKPAPGYFRVTVNNARRHVEADGVAISGQTVTLTLASAVSAGDTVTVRYARPLANPLRGANGIAVAAFADQPVTVLETIWEATLTVGTVLGLIVGCHSEEQCSSRLTDASFTHGGTEYRVFAIREFPVSRSLGLGLTSAISSDWTLHVDQQTFSVADANLSPDKLGANWPNAVVAWRVGQQVSLRLAAPSGASGEAGGASGDSGGAEPASVTGVQVVSDAGADDTYGLGDTIHVRVTFDETVDVTGTPRLKIDMDPAEWGEKWAAYQSGSGTASLTFAHTVVEPNISTQGIAVVTNSLELNGGTIRSGGADADLSHTGLPHNADHQVDWQAEPESGGGASGNSGRQQQQSAPPAVTKVEVTSNAGDDDTYAKDDVIQITLTFSEKMDVTGTPRLKIDLDPADWGEKWAAYASGGGATELTFAHTVVEPNISTQGIAVLEDSLELNGGTIQSDGADADLSHTGLGHDPEHKVDWRPPAPAVTKVEVTPQRRRRRHLRQGRRDPDYGHLRRGGGRGHDGRNPPPEDRPRPGGLGREVGQLRQRQRRNNADLHPHRGGAQHLHPGHRRARQLAGTERRGPSSQRQPIPPPTCPTPSWTTTRSTRWTGSSPRRRPTLRPPARRPSPARPGWARP